MKISSGAGDDGPSFVTMYDFIVDDWIFPKTLIIESEIIWIHWSPSFEGYGGKGFEATIKRKEY